MKSINKRVAKKQIVHGTAIKGLENDKMQHILQLHKLAVLFPELSQHFNQQMVTLANSQKIRLDPSIKHTFCKKCFSSLSLGLVTIKNGKLIVICSECDSERPLKKLL